MHKFFSPRNNMASNPFYRNKIKKVIDTYPRILTAALLIMVPKKKNLNPHLYPSYQNSWKYMPHTCYSSPLYTRGKSVCTTLGTCLSKIQSAVAIGTDMGPEYLGLMRGFPLLNSETKGMSLNL